MNSMHILKISTPSFWHILNDSLFAFSFLLSYILCTRRHGLLNTWSYIHGHISYIFEVNSKKPIREKQKIKRKQSYAEEIE